MWTITGWAIGTWLKLTLTATLAVLLAWWWLGTGCGWFWTVCAAATTAEVWTVRGLAREWAHEAHATWWWAP